MVTVDQCACLARGGGVGGVLLDCYRQERYSSTATRNISSSEWRASVLRECFQDGQ
jgi:hypothetical protein